ncbi:hypothetical protein EJB05_46466, partial [Eragrostis curvula]
MLRDSPVELSGATPGAAVTILDKYVSSVAGSLVSMALALCPALHYMWYGDFENTIFLWNEKGMEISLANGLIWLVYGVYLWKYDRSMEAILSGAWQCASSLSFILICCGFTRQRKKGICWFILTMIFIAMALVLSQLDLSAHSLSIIETCFGLTGFAAVIASHFFQAKDLFSAEEPIQLLSAFIIIAPGAFFAIVQIAITFLGHKKQNYMTYACYVNAIAYPIELTSSLKNCWVSEMVWKLSTTVSLGDDEIDYRDWLQMQHDYQVGLQQLFEDEEDRDQPYAFQDDEISLSGRSLQQLFAEEEAIDGYQADAFQWDQLSQSGRVFELLFGEEEDVEEHQHDVNRDLTVDYADSFEHLFQEVNVEDTERNFFAPILLGSNEPNDQLIENALELPLEGIDDNQQDSNTSEREIGDDGVGEVRLSNNTRQRITLGELAGINPSYQAKTPDHRTKARRSGATSKTRRVIPRWLSFGCHES